MTRFILTKMELILVAATAGLAYILGKVRGAAQNQRLNDEDKKNV